MPVARYLSRSLSSDHGFWPHLVTCGLRSSISFHRDHRRERRLPPLAPQPVLAVAVASQINGHYCCARVKFVLIRTGNSPG